MIEHVYRRAMSARNVDSVIVATDDSRIADAVAKFGGDVRMTRSTHSTGTDRIAEVAATLDCDLIVNLQGDEPLIEPAAIDEAIEPFRDDAALQMTSLCQRVQRARRRGSIPTWSRSSPIAAVSRCTSRARRFRSSATAAGAAPQQAGPYKHIGLYVQRREFLLTVASLEPTPLERAEALEQLRVLEHGYAIRMIRNGARLDGRGYAR